MKIYFLERKQIIPRSRSETFAFFSDAFNLERITPPFLRFRIVTPAPIKMEAGAVIEYRLALFGAPIYWSTVIESWAPEESFVDSQTKGPYALWRHTHTWFFWKGVARAESRACSRTPPVLRLGSSNGRKEFSLVCRVLPSNFM